MIATKTLQVEAHPLYDGCFVIARCDLYLAANGGWTQDAIAAKQFEDAEVARCVIEAL